jgi:lipopolysaccharide export system permease protein
MKKIDKLVLNAFLGPFLITFLVVVFILLNINMLKYFDDIIGKGLDTWTLGQLFFYFAIFTIPTALPLAVLLSSLISFGNLGEHFELTAIKAAGISLLRALLPIFVFVLLLTVAAFYANNNLVPKAALEAYSLLYDIKQKKPALDLREGSFYYGINDISIKVNKKFPDGITLKDVIVYDHRKNDGNKEVTVADSGKMYTILNERYLKFELFNGYNYTEGATSEREMAGQKGRNNESLSRSQFSKTQVVFDLSSFQLQRTDKQWFQGNRMMRNMGQLDADIDSMRREILSQRLSQFQTRGAFFNYFMKGDTLILPTDILRHKVYKDSMTNAEYLAQTQGYDPFNQPKDSSDMAKRDTLAAASPTPIPTDTQPSTKAPSAVTPENSPTKLSKTAAAKKDKASRFARQRPARQVKENPRQRVNPDRAAQAPLKKIQTPAQISARLDSVLAATPDVNMYQAAGNSARQIKSQISNINVSIENFNRDLKVFEIQWHKIIASSFACIAMFLIGAPLGAIIKRGGLGVPFLVSILFFIIYYVVTMQGEKLAKQGSLGVIAGVWIADMILLFIGLFFLKQARADARLFEADFYHVAFDKVKRWLVSRGKRPKQA